MAKRISGVLLWPFDLLPFAFQHSPFEHSLLNLALLLFVFRIRANHPNHTLPENDLAILTNTTHAGSNLHDTPLGSMPVSDSSLRKIIRTEFNRNPVAGEDPDVILSHLPGYMSHKLVVILELDPEHRIGQCIDHLAVKLNFVFLGQIGSAIFKSASPRLQSDLVSICQYLASIGSDGNRMFIVGRRLAICRHDCPTIVKRPYLAST